MGRNSFVGRCRLQLGRLLIYDTIGVIGWATLSVGVGYLGGALLTDSPILALVIGAIVEGLGSLVGLLIQKLLAWLFDWNDVRYGVSTL